MLCRREFVAFEGNTELILISCSSQCRRLEVRLVIPVEGSHVRRSWLDIDRSDDSRESAQGAAKGPRLENAPLLVLHDIRT